MALFKRRTSKDVGKSVGASIRRQQSLQKELRTLRKEDTERRKEEKLKNEIKTLRRNKPTALKKIVGGVKKYAVSPAVAAAQSRSLAPRRRIKTSRKRIRQPRRKSIVVKKMIKNPSRKRRITTKKKPRQQMRESVPAGFEGIY